MKKPVALNMRLSAELAAAMDERAAEQGLDRSSLVRAALEAYLNSPTLTVEQRLRALERAVGDINRRLELPDVSATPTRSSTGAE
jgi:metal-responsive CopG/Arc/MetJ family transcriptional regulator